MLAVRAMIGAPILPRGSTSLLQNGEARTGQEAMGSYEATPPEATKNVGTVVVKPTSGQAVLTG